MGKKVRVWVALLILVISVYAIYYSYNQDCDLMPKIESPAGSQIPTIEYPDALKKVMCLGADFKLVIINVLGIIGLSASGYELIKQIIGGK